MPVSSTSGSEAFLMMLLAIGSDGGETNSFAVLG